MPEHWVVEGIVDGLLGGSVALGAGASLWNPKPLAANVLAGRMTGRAPEDARLLAAGLRTAWFGLVGGVFAWFVAYYVDTPSDLSFYTMVYYGLAWGLALWLLGLAWMAVLGVPRLLAAEPGAMGRVAAATLWLWLLYGLVLGGLFASLG